jgi:hypothetical protein
MRNIHMQTPTSGTTPRRRWTRCLGIGATTVVAASAVASAAGAAAPKNSPVGASGSVAAITGTTMEVQNPSSGQTAVSWTPTTKFAKTVTEAVGSITVGTCVTATGTPAKNSKTMIPARSVTVTTASSTGSCTGGGTRFGGAPGGGAGGFQFRRGGGFPGGGGPEGGTPRSIPSNIRNRFASFSIASGKVTGVNGSTLTVSGINVSPGSFNSKSSKSKRPTAPKTETLKITTTSSTTVSATHTAASADLAVGACVTALGPAAANGSVTADTVRISSSVNGSCTGGFARFGRGGPGGGGFPGGGFPGGGGGGA